MHWLAWVLFSVFFSVGYRLSYKFISDKLSPLLAVSLIMFLVSLISLGLFFILLWGQGEASAFKNLPDMLSLQSVWPLFVVGCVVAGLEVSILMVYRVGGPVSIAQSLMSNTTSVMVFFGGILIFEERLNTVQCIGFLFAIVGVSLMSFFSRPQRQKKKDT